MRCPSIRQGGIPMGKTESRRLPLQSGGTESDAGAQMQRPLLAPDQDYDRILVDLETANAHSGGPRCGLAAAEPGTGPERLVHEARQSPRAISIAFHLRAARTSSGRLPPTACSSCSSRPRWLILKPRWKSAGRRGRCCPHSTESAKGSALIGKSLYCGDIHLN